MGIKYFREHIKLYQHQKYIIYAPKIKYSSPVSSSVFPIMVPYSDPMIREAVVSFRAQRITFVQF